MVDHNAEVMSKLSTVTPYLWLKNDGNKVC
jgi:hypothetical protein